MRHPWARLLLRLGVISTLLGAVLLRPLIRYLRRNTLQPGAVAIITGGGSGVGAEIAKIFARAHCKVVLVGRNVQALQASLEDCLTAGALEAHYIAADISTKAGCDQVAHEFAALHGNRLQYLVLNAGAGAIVPFSAGEDFVNVCNSMMDVNFTANVRLLQHFLPQLEHNHRMAVAVGASPCMVVVISSLAGVLPSILRSSYTASKHAIQGFVNALRGETPVPITLCCPGYVDTDFHQRVLTSDGKPLEGNTRRGISPAKCAARCMDGARSGDMEVIFTWLGWLGYALRPLLPRFVDSFAKRKSLKSVNHKC